MAIVLEAARLLPPLTSRYSIIYAFWDEEELGWLGSWAFAYYADLQNLNIRGAINIDMVGYDSDDDGTILLFSTNIGGSDALADTVCWANDYYGIGLSPTITDWTGSDYGSFWAFNYGATGFGELYPDDLNPCFHRSCDVFESFNLNYFHRNARLGISSLAILAHINSDNEIILADCYQSHSCIEKYRKVLFPNLSNL